MDTRRSFLRKMALLSGAAGLNQVFPPSIQRAFAIDPAPGSTYLDAEHIVLLMQENRSFDHAFGMLRGVRGFNDPRAVDLPNKNKVWLQTNKAGETYAPFRLDIKDTKITWMGSLPHGRESQVDARNEGNHDGWLDAKRSGYSEYADMPLTMGHYTREDIPFYYALADAFTVCDQNFCSSLTGTDPNRVYFWSGTVRKKPDEQERAFVDNGSIESGIEWRTFPELLEESGVSWKVYQNELYVEGGFTEEEDRWLGNFGDNPLEYFAQYKVRLSARYRDYLPQKAAKLRDEIEKLKAKGQTGKALTDRQAELEKTLEEQQKWTAEKYDQLPGPDKSIHEKAFAVNTGDPDQHRLTPLTYMDGQTKREINIPKGDLFYQFREDVKSGTLPTVSWLVAPENFSDHPDAPWFGSWYLSEAMDILTQNPEVWKKTIFILAYDENDGYFDHVPPFVAPDPRDPSTGKASPGIDTGIEQVRLEQDSPGSIGLGFRVPLVIASPWSRGGWVNSQVFDHTSTLQFLEGFLLHKTGKQIVETNISGWRRTICGDLTSVFRADDGKGVDPLPFLQKDPFIEGIHKAKFKKPPADFKTQGMPVQEKGVKPSCALPYELFAEGRVAGDLFTIDMTAGNRIFGTRSAGSPFNVYANATRRMRSYAVSPGTSLQDSWALADLEGNGYHLKLYGPNGFFREFRGNAKDPSVDVSCVYQQGNVEVRILNRDARPVTVVIRGNAYKTHSVTHHAPPGATSVILYLQNSFSWYDFTVFIKGHEAFERRYAGRVETGKPTYSDPEMGQVVM